jgi:hypothetical protein
MVAPVNANVSALAVVAADAAAVANTTIKAIV